jgi:uncharacterized protein YdeI (YjbR/CyaY-like superfamily)
LPITRDARSALKIYSRQSWRKWLAKNYDVENEALLIIHKRPPKNAKFSNRDALEEALCFGWIDGWFKPLDDERWVIRYTPRRKGSNWSPYNIASAWKLLNQGLMTQAGIVKLPKDAIEVWKEHKPKPTIITNIGGAQGRRIEFADGMNYLLMIKIPARAP